GVVVARLGDRLLEDRRVRRDADDALAEHPAKLAGAQPAALDVVEPRAGARGREIVQTGHDGTPPWRRCDRTRWASSATWRGVKPRCSSTVAPGAEAPNRSSATIAPCSPANRSQPSDAPASMQTRASTDGGITCSR